MFNIFDLIMLAVIIGFIVAGCVRGEIKTVLSFAGGIVSIFISTILGKTLANGIYDALFRKSIIDEISSSVTEVMENGATSIGDSVVSALPGFIQNLLGDKIVASVNGMSFDSSQQIATGVATAVEQVISPVCIAMITVIVSVVLFVILKVLLGILFHCADFLNNIPVIGTANKIVGGILGAVYGVLAVFLITLIISCFSAFFNQNGILNEEIMNDSLCFSVVNGEDTASYLEKFYDPDNMYIDNIW